MLLSAASAPPPAATLVPRVPDSLGQALTLALLLHVLLLLIVGNTPGGSAKPGEGLWGSIQVRLQGDRQQPGADTTVVLPPEPGPVGSARQQRFGGTVRPEPAPQADKTPGAARVGQWRAQPGETLRGESAPADTSPPAPSPTADPAPATPTAAEPSPPTLALPPEPLPRLSTPPLPKAAPQTAPAPLATPSPLPELLSAPEPSTTRVMQPAPDSPASPRLSLPRPDPLDRAAAPEASPLQAPSPSLQLPKPTLSEQPSPSVNRLQREAVDRAPRAQPLPLDELKAPARLPELAPAPSVDATPRPAPQSRPDVTTPAPTATQSQAAAPPATTPRPAQVANPRVSLDGSTPSEQPRAGAPDAGSRLGLDVATPPSAPSSAPRLNLSLPGARGPMLPRSGSVGIVKALPNPPEAKDKLKEELQKAGQQDCRQAYADKGLLAVVPLVRDTVRDKGCRW